MADLQNSGEAGGADILSKPDCDRFGEECREVRIFSCSLKNSRVKGMMRKFVAEPIRIECLEAAVLQSSQPLGNVKAGAPTNQDSVEAKQLACQRAPHKGTAFQGSQLHVEHPECNTAWLTALIGAGQIPRAWSRSRWQRRRRSYGTHKYDV